MPASGRPHCLARARGAVVVSLLVASGCGTGQKGCAASRSAPANTNAEPVFTDVVVLDRGAEPRVDLKVSRWAGLRYRVFLRAVGSLTPAGKPPAPGPILEMMLAYDVLRGSANPVVARVDGGTSRLVEEHAVVENVAVRDDPLPRPLVDAWNLALVPLRNTSFKQLVAEDSAIAFAEGELLGGAKPPEELAKALDRALDGQRQFPFRLPLVSVGVGAKWRFRHRIDVLGAKVSEVADMTLKSIAGSNAVVGIRVHQEAPPQQVAHPQKSNHTVTLETWTGDGDGEITVDRLTAIPVGGRLLVTTHLSISDGADARAEKASLVGTTYFEEAGGIVAERDAGAPDLRAAPGAPP